MSGDKKVKKAIEKNKQEQEKQKQQVASQEIVCTFCIYFLAI